MHPASLIWRRENPGAESPDLGWASPARLKSCPDPKHHCCDYRKTRVFNPGVSCESSSLMISAARRPSPSTSGNFDPASAGQTVRLHIYLRLSHIEGNPARHSGFITYIPLASKARIPVRQFVSTTEVDYRRTEPIRYKRYRSLSLPSPMTPVTISYRAGHRVSRPARRVGRDHLVLQSVAWLAGFEVGKAAINPAAVLRPGDPDRVDTW
jgi:hypothetical protein